MSLPLESVTRASQVLRSVGQAGVQWPRAITEDADRSSPSVPLPPAKMNGGPSIWAITPEERVKHDQKFDTLSPSMGFVSGEQARKFLLQSGLPASVLAEIWALADMNKDGKMDRLEFSIAMKLIKLKLQGASLPSALPIIMKQPPVPVPSLNNPTIPLTSPAYGMASVPNMSLMPGTNLAMLNPITMATPGLSPLTPMTGFSTLVPTATGLSPLMASTASRPLMPTMGSATLPNGTIGILHPLPAGALATGVPRSASPYSSPLGFSSSGMNKASSLLDLGSISSTSSSPLATVPSDWAVPHASRLKYRQQFNSLDKQMTGYLSGQQVRGAMATTMLTQSQLASIWTLADVDKDGKLKADEFILAMHLVDMAKTGQHLPLTLPTELVPPSQRSTVNGSSSSLYVTTDDLVIEPPQSAKPKMSFEDKFKANLERGNAELEKRRLAMQEVERRERERHEQKEREEREKKEKEAREAEERRRKEEERRLERQRELERQIEEELEREKERKEAAQRELERQRKEEWEKRRRGELQIKKEQEQDDIIKLKAKKRSLEMELEAVGNKHRQISDRLRDFQNKKKLQKTEMDLINQRKETRQQDINNLQKQLEILACLTVFHVFLVSTMSTLKMGVTERKGKCVKLREQLESLEKETAAHLSEMDQYNKDVQHVGDEDSLLQAVFCLLACLRNLFYLLKNLRSIKEDKRRELSRRMEEEEERRRREEERKQQEMEAQRRIKMEKDRQWQEKLRKDEMERQRRLQEEKEARQREEEERERLALIQAAKEQAEQELRAREEAERKIREVEERKKREEEERQKQAERRRQEEERRKLEEERRQLEEERRKLEEERKKEEKRWKEEEERRMREEEKKRLEEEQREEERRREKEEEERRRERAAMAAVRDSEERRKREEGERKKREEEERRKREEDMAKLQQQQQDEDRRKREEERKRAEEMRMRKEEEQERRKAEEVRKRKEEAPRGQPRATEHRKSAALTSFKALYPFTARNNEELNISADDIIEG
ncbi:hypothetical protein FQN60_010776 [Etheostoma spectabile]|uniref:Intersectin 2b n=1 Tax=Etheostoma spectabile TaxID=54343 RepID=A0A5J5DQ60_9PERO|nr:hypothetical protein FQN60_010776 [Etheostoma spectabile]